MLIRFLTSGVSPEIGEFMADEERGIPDSIAHVYVARKLVVEVSIEKPAPVRAAKKEVTDNGGD